MIVPPDVIEWAELVSDGLEADDPGLNLVVAVWIMSIADS